MPSQLLELFFDSSDGGVHPLVVKMRALFAWQAGVGRSLSETVKKKQFFIVGLPKKKKKKKNKQDRKVGYQI